MDLRTTEFDAPSTAVLHRTYSASFRLNRAYDNPYDPAQIDIQVEVELPSGRRIGLPAFWFQDYTVVPGSQQYEHYVPAGTAHWKVRFLPEETGQHRLRLSAREWEGRREEIGACVFDVRPARERGVVRRHPAQPLMLQHANGSLYLPRGHNLCFEDGNPDLNGTAYYAQLLSSFSAAGENWTRFWMTDFARTALEWGRNHPSEFYSGAGRYSQRAAKRVDSFLDLAAANGVYVQLVLNDHGQFSSFVDARWNSGNPYNAAEGGPIPQKAPELFFSTPAARSLFLRRLRYIVARWSAYPNLLAWELWNEVQFAGSLSRNFQNDGLVRAAIVDWHRVMSEYLKALDPFSHLVTTSSDDAGSPGWPSIWNLSTIDMVQSHHYAEPASARDLRLRDYTLMAQRCYAKPVVIAETGIKASTQPECGFDPDAFMTNADIPATERTRANRDHIMSGTTMRNAIWAAAMTRSGAMNWWWGCYISPDERLRRRAPEFPLNERFFPALAAFWGGEDADEPFQNSALDRSGEILAVGLQDRARAYLWVRDQREAYDSGVPPARVDDRRIEGAKVTLRGFDPGTYVASIHETMNHGDTVVEVTLSSVGGTLELPLPPLLGDAAVKVSHGTQRGWGIVPRSSKVWITRNSGPVGPGYALLRPALGAPPVAAAAVLTLFEGEDVTSEVTVPAVAVARSIWGVAESAMPSDTGIALANPGRARATIKLEVFDSAGRALHEKSLELAPGAHLSRFLRELVPELAGTFHGTLRLTSDMPVGSLTLRRNRNSHGESIFTTLPTHQDNAPRVHERLVLPQVLAGGGYRTEWLLMNPYDVPLSGSVRFFHSDGRPWSLEVDGSSQAERLYQVQPHGLLRWFSSGEPIERQSGYCLLDPADLAPAAAAIIQYSPGGELQGETGIPFAHPVAKGGTYWETDPDIFTGVVFANVSSQSCRIQIELFVRNGVERKFEAALELAAGRRAARRLSELFPHLPEWGRGYLRYSSDGAVSFLGLRFRRTPRGATLTSSVRLAEIDDATEWTFPQVVSGGGYETRLVLLNVGNLTSEGRIEFRDATGVPVRVLLRGPGLHR